MKKPYLIYHYLLFLDHNRRTSEYQSDHRVSSEKDIEDIEKELHGRIKNFVLIRVEHRILSLILDTSRRIVQVLWETGKEIFKDFWENKKTITVWVLIIVGFLMLGRLESRFEELKSQYYMLTLENQSNAEIMINLCSDLEINRDLTLKQEFIEAFGGGFDLKKLNKRKGP